MPYIQNHKSEISDKSVDNIQYFGEETLQSQTIRGLNHPSLPSNPYN